MASNLRYFTGSIVATIAGLLLGGGVGYYYTGTWTGTLSSALTCAILSVLEVSLSFDNAVVNATVLRKMTHVWKRRFLTWGMLIAVFGMRLIFPLAIVGIVARVNPWDALRLAATHPDEYARIMQSVHIPVAAFGGSFLLMVALRYFFDTQKDVHWIASLERPLVKLGRLEAVELAIAMLAIYLISRSVPDAELVSFLVSGLMGLVTFIFVDGIGAVLESGELRAGSASGVTDAHKASAGLFLYLEVLDASFSFDGVVGAFAITNNLFVITIGLGIGAMFVRSLTIMLVEKGTLSHYRYLEHGAFYAIAALAAIMFLNTSIHISEVVTGLIGVGVIGLSLWSSIRYNRKRV